MTSLEERLDALEEQAALLVDAVDLDTVWIIWCGIMVFCECCCCYCLYLQVVGVELAWRVKGAKDLRERAVVILARTGYAVTAI